MNKYITLSDIDAMHYRDIAERMTKMGWKMNHSHARGIFMSGIEKLARSVILEMRGSVTHADIKRLMSDDAFYVYISDFLQEHMSRAHDKL